MGAAGKATDGGELHAGLRPLEVRIQLCTPPLEALARNFAASPVEATCGFRSSREQMLCEIIQPTPGFVDQCIDKFSVSCSLVAPTMLCRRSIAARSSGSISSGAWVPDGHIKQLLTKLAWAKSADIEPSLFLRCGQRWDIKVAACTQAGLVEDVTPSIAQAVMAEDGQRAAGANTGMIAVRVPRLAAKIAFRRIPIPA